MQGSCMHVSKTFESGVGCCHFPHSSDLTWRRFRSPVAQDEPIRAGAYSWAGIAHDYTGLHDCFCGKNHLMSRVPTEQVAGDTKALR